jgi:hypothetical protein
MQAESILTIIILFAFMTLLFLSTGAHRNGLRNAVRSTWIGAAIAGFLADTMAALEDRRGDGCCAHTKDGSYQRLVVRSEYRVTYLEFLVCW